MPTIDELVVRIDGDTTKLKRALNEADTTARRTGRRLAASFTRADRALRGLGRGLGRFSIATTAASAGVALFVRRAIQAADDIGKTADKVGLTTDELQELRFAADQTGVAAGTLDMAMQRFSRRVGEAALGTGELKDTLLKYGITLTDSEGRTRNITAILGDLADAMANAGSDQERLRIAFKAFDSEGAALVNTLRKGSAGLERLRAEARGLGIVLDRDTIRGAERANDELNRMSRVLSVAGSRLALEFIPVLKELADAITDPGTIEGARDLATQMRSMISFMVENKDAVVAVAGAISGMAVGRLLGPYGVLGGGVAGALAGIKLMSDGAKEIAEEMRSVEAQIEELSGKSLPEFLKSESLSVYGEHEEKLAALVKRLVELDDQLKEMASRPAPEPDTGTSPARPGTAPVGLSEKDKALIDSLEFQTEQLKRNSREQFVNTAVRKASDDATKGQLATIRQLAGALFDETLAIEQQNAAAQESLRMWEEHEAALAEAEAEYGRQEIAIRGISVSLKEEGERLRRLVEAQETSNKERRITEALIRAENEAKAEGRDLTEEETASIRRQIEANDRLRQKLDQNTDAGRDFAHVTSTALEDAIVHAEDFRDVLAGVLEQIQRIILRISATKPLEDALSPVIKGGISAITSGLFGGGATGAEASFQSADAGFRSGGVMTSSGPLPLRRYQSGGVATMPQMALFGEGSSPEAFVPLPDGRSIPVTIKGGDSGVTIVQHNNFAVGLRAEVRGEIMAMLPRIADTAAQAVQSRNFRDPDFLGRRR